ncbi:MAG: DUF378 domain-containing protein [Candidatus Doudnabacteria bacterium]|nr:DUF378 domain-containing protein [Candidatus Doudnabacteria bacterium]
MGHNKGLHMVTFTLLAIGGLNWGLALFGWDVGTWGLPSMLVKIVYALVALSALYEIFTHGSRCKECKGDMGMNRPPM